MKTLGGVQFWADVQFFHDWRIQRNTFTGHHRLLDGRNGRHASGSLADCRKRLDEIKAERGLPAMSGKGVILIHGIIRSSRSFDRLRAALQEEGYTIFGFDYPSTRITIPEAADDLDQVIRSLDGIEEIHFVVHSMGGLVVRSWCDRHRDPRVKRMVMLGTPNCGAEMADLLRNNPLFRLVFGPAGQQLVCDKAGLIAGLPTPPFEFAIIAGARGTAGGFNPLIPGDDDGTITVACTRLPGAADFLTVPCLHSFLMGNDAVIRATTRFLQDGRFRADAPAQPIAR